MVSITNQAVVMNTMDTTIKNTDIKGKKDMVDTNIITRNITVIITNTTRRDIIMEVAAITRSIIKKEAIIINILIMPIMRKEVTITINTITIKVTM